MHWRFIETAHYDRVTCRFEGDSLRIEFKKSISILNPDMKDERPAVLALWHYANGAVVVVESDMAPRPGQVSRVVLEVPAVAGARCGQLNPSPTSAASVR